MVADVLTSRGQAVRAVYDAITAEPERFDMATWACETSLCIAGWVVLLNGAQPTYASERDSETGMACYPDGTEVIIADEAMRLFRIRDGEEPFFMSNEDAYAWLEARLPREDHDH